MLNTTDLDAPYEDAGAAFSTPSSRAAARRIRRTRQRMGLHRHALLISMRMLNGVEAEMVQSEWENWLSDENARCEQVRSMLLYEAPDPSKGSGKMSARDKANAQQAQQMLGGKFQGSRQKLQAWHEEYCGSCGRDQHALLQRSHSLVLGKTRPLGAPES